MGGGGGDGTQGGITFKVVTTVVTKRPCIPVAQINGFSGMTYIQIYIQIKKKETIHSKISSIGGGTFQYTQNLVRCLIVTI